MKKYLLVLFLALGGSAFQSANAQVHISVNIGSQPVWGPVGYDYVDYYYLPDIDVFYNVPRRVYYYEDGGRWIYSRYLPVRYRSYDLYSGYKVVINNDPRPYRNIATYRTRYAPYRGRRDQVIIRNSNDSRYYEIKEHPNHGQWKGNGNGNGHGNGHGKGKGNKGRR